MKRPTSLKGNLKRGIALKVTDFAHQNERTYFQDMLVKNPNYFGNLPDSKIKPKKKLIKKTDYEQLTCVGYNPDTENMQAAFAIKKSVGFSGNLCTAGSTEYLRFYLDFHDGTSFIDQGMVAVNVHDIPYEKDCNNNSVFPIIYVATLKKKTNKFCNCKKPVLPTLRAVLSWGQEPPANTPNWYPVWGDVLESDVQLKANWLFHLKEFPFEAMKFLDFSTDFPQLTSKQLMDISGFDKDKLGPQPEPPELEMLAKISKKLRLPPTRFAFKTVQKMIKYPTSEITLMNVDILKKANIDISKLIDTLNVDIPIDKSKANVDYEELECIGLDYNMENLVATLNIKKKYGFIGDLCSGGSKEYVSFWIDWDDSCTWEYLNTTELKVHDIQMDGPYLSYSISLPLDTTFRKKLCNNPNIVRIRGVLSWNTPPSITNPDKLEYYGNRVDAHIQIKPGTEINPGDVIPLFNIIGGIDVAHVNDITGLTKPGSFFAFNGHSVPTNAPFGGTIVLNGPSFTGNRYKIKVTNLNDGTFFFSKEPFTVVGFLPYAPWVQYTTQHVDSNGFYPFLMPDKNTLNVLARFKPPSEDKYLVELVVDTIPGVFSKVIQMDNSKPQIKIKVDDNGVCTHYKKGDTITGHYFVSDKYIDKWNFASTWGGNKAGTSNTNPLPGNHFSIPTSLNAYPCGNVRLHAWDKTIVDSQWVRRYKHTSYNICLSSGE